MHTSTCTQQSNTCSGAGSTCRAGCGGQGRRTHLAAPNKENEEVVVVARLEERHASLHGMPASMVATALTGLTTGRGAHTLRSEPRPALLPLRTRQSQLHLPHPPSLHSSAFVPFLSYLLSGVRVSVSRYLRSRSVSFVNCYRSFRFRQFR